MEQESEITKCPQCGGSDEIYQDRYDTAPHCEACGWPEDDFGAPVHWPIYTTTVQKVGDKVEEVYAQNIREGKFLIDQVYGFQVNPLQRDSESCTVHRCIIPAGTEVEDGYKAVREFLKHMGYCPAVVCPALGMSEIVGMCNE